MANPNSENGHIDIPHELAEALMRVNLSGYYYRIIWCIFRKTYGWHKDRDGISLTQFQNMTGLDRRHVNRTLKNLEDMDMILVDRSSHINIYKFNGDYERWILRDSAILGTSTRLGTKVVPDMELKVVPELAHTKERKETIQKKLVQKEYKESIEFKLSEFLFNKIKENNPGHKQPNLNTWVTHIDKMIRLDNRDPEKIKEVIEWCQANDFWQANILSTKKLREKFDQLFMQMNRKLQTSEKQPEGKKLREVD